MNIKEFLDLLHSEADKHELSSGLVDLDLQEWQSRNPDLELPEDYLAFLRLHNGFRLYPDKDTPIGSVRLLPLQEIVTVRSLVYENNSDVDSVVPSSWLVLTDDPDSTRFLVYDVEKCHYFELEPMDPSDIEVMGDKMERVLDWLANYLES